MFILNVWCQEKTDKEDQHKTYNLAHESPACVSYVVIFFGHTYGGLCMFELWGMYVVRTGTPTHVCACVHAEAHG